MPRGPNESNETQMLKKNARAVAKMTLINSAVKKTKQNENFNEFIESDCWTTRDLTKRQIFEGSTIFVLLRQRPVIFCTLSFSQFSNLLIGFLKCPIYGGKNRQ